MSKKKKDQWSKNQAGYIVSVNETFPELEAGYYSIRSSMSMGMYFQKENIETNKLYPMPNEATKSVLSDIQKFWTLEDVYKKYERVFRRNYLIYSAPGTGKSSLIKIMCQELIEKYNGIIFNIDSAESLALYPGAINRVRSVEPNRKIITIIEDIDTFIGNEGGYVNTSIASSALLNILDGALTTGNIVTIATTNYIEKIEARYKNRPSRFDMVIEFPLPNDESRKTFIEKTVKPEDLDKIDIDKWVKRTKGYSIDNINELILLFFVFGHSENEAFSRIQKMVDANDSLVNEISTNKKKIGFNEHTAWGATTEEMHPNVPYPEDLEIRLPKKSCY